MEEVVVGWTGAAAVSFGVMLGISFVAGSALVVHNIIGINNGRGGGEEQKAAVTAGNNRGSSGRRTKES